LRFLETADAQEANRGRLPQACPPRRWLRNGELAGYLGVSKMTLWRFKREPDFPPAATINNIDFNDLDKVDAWMLARPSGRYLQRASSFEISSAQ
jgi:predicted DNA-binding transcriptional regulator AlpA